MTPKIERVAENFVLGEGPHWDESTQSLYFIDCMGQSINRYVPATKSLRQLPQEFYNKIRVTYLYKIISTPKIEIDKSKTILWITANQTLKMPQENIFARGAHVSFIIPIKDQKNTFLITREREFRVITWDGESDKFSIVRNIETEATVNFNDGKVDPTGRLWTGTIGIREGGGVDEGVGSLYAVEKDTIKKVADKITISNGLAFNTELKKLYYIDSHEKTIDEFDLDVEKGTIKNRHAIFTLESHDIPGIPDGMAIDTDGNLWVAIFNGSRVIKIDPRKPETLLYTLALPAQQVTSVAFGGKNLDELYVTTGRIEFGTTEKLTAPVDGALYRVTGLGVRGYPGENFVL